MARLEIQFLQSFDIGDYISFDLVQVRPSGTFTRSVIETCASVRASNGQFTISGTTSGTATNFRGAVLLDHLGYIKSSDSTGNEIYIDSLDGYTIENFQTNAPTKISYNISNPVDIGTLNLVSITTQESSTDPCNMFEVTMVFSETILSYFLNSDGSWVTHNSDTVTFDYPRERLLSGSFSSANYPLQDEDLYVYFPYSTNDQNMPTVQGEFIVVPALTTQKINLVITPTITGGSININSNGLDFLDLEYSLNNVDWQTENSFTGQPDGSGTLYIRDNYGCKISIDYTINAIGVAEPYAYISEANTIGFKLCQDIDNINTFKNYYNAFDSEDYNLINYCDSVLLQISDKFKIQIKTNYSNIDFKVRNENGTETTLIPERLTANLGRRSELDGKIYTHTSGRLGIYFDTGNTYDENSNVDGTHELNGNLPDFAVKDNNIFIQDIGGYKIYDVIFDRTLQKKAILIDLQYSGGLQTKKIDCIYNSLEYEVYSVYMDWSLFTEGLYDCVVTFSDDNYDDIVMVSENIDLATIHEGVMTIFYSNDKSNNKDVFYIYDITHIIRVPYLEFFGNIKDSSDLVISDNSTNLTSSRVSILDEFTFGEFSRTVSRKLSIALSCENVFINGVGYSKDGGLSLSKIENTNIYTLEAKMIDNNSRWSTKYNEDTGFDADYQDIFIPELLNFNDKFVKK